MEADVIWVVVAGALVLFMTPGLALFYGGLTQTKSAVNMMMMSFAAMGLVAITWTLWGDAMSFGTSIGGLFGNPADNFAAMAAGEAGAPPIAVNSLMASGVASIDTLYVDSAYVDLDADRIVSGVLAPARGGVPTGAISGHGGVLLKGKPQFVQDDPDFADKRASVAAMQKSHIHSVIGC